LAAARFFGSVDDTEDRVVRADPRLKDIEYRSAEEHAKSESPSCPLYNPIEWPRSSIVSIAKSPQECGFR